MDQALVRPMLSAVRAAELRASLISAGKCMESYVRMMTCCAAAATAAASAAKKAREHYWCHVRVMKLRTPTSMLQHDKAHDWLI